MNSAQVCTKDTDTWSAAPDAAAAARLQKTTRPPKSVAASSAPALSLHVRGVKATDAGALTFHYGLSRTPTLHSAAWLARTSSRWTLRVHGAALDAHLRLRGEHLGDRRRVVRLGDPRGVRPVVLVGVPE